MGLTVEGVFEKLVAGESGITRIERFDTTDFTTKIGGEVKGWDGPTTYSESERPKARKRLDRFVQFAMDASRFAVEDAGLDLSEENPWRCGCIIGTGVGGIEEFAEGHQRLLERGPSRVSPFMVPKLMCNAGVGNVSIELGLKGPNFSVATACASGAHSIGEAAETIRHNAADVMIAGGAEAALTPLGTSCFIALKALSKRNDEPTLASRPFDADRDGFVLTEGAAILVLEELEHARKRNARIYCEVTGFGQSADGSHITAPLADGSGAAHAMTAAINDAGLQAEQIDYVNAHGTSTGLGDLAETAAIKLALGAKTRTPVSSTKSMTGHALGAAGGIEAVILAKVLQEGVLPPTINLDQPDEGCDLDYVPHTARDAEVQHAISNSFGFGGHNVSLIMSKI